jgi:hypothetical protein
MQNVPTHRRNEDVLVVQADEYFIHTTFADSFNNIRVAEPEIDVHISVQIAQDIIWCHRLVTQNRFPTGNVVAIECVKQYLVAEGFQVAHDAVTNNLWEDFIKATVHVRSVGHPHFVPLSRKQLGHCKI